MLKIQNAARNSTEWFEHVDRYVDLPPEQFAYSLLTRSQRISHENLRLRDKEYVEDYEDWIAAAAGVTRAPTRHSIPPMLTPFTLRGVRCRTASSSRRWRSTRASTACRATSTSSTSARAPWAAPAWSSPR